MDTTEVILNLPADLVERAREAGILENSRITRLLEAELQREIAVTRLFNNLAKLRSVEPPLTPEEIDTEIRAYRAEKAAHRSNK